MLFDISWILSYFIQTVQVHLVVLWCLVDSCWFTACHFVLFNNYFFTISISYLGTNKKIIAKNKLPTILTSHSMAVFFLSHEIQMLTVVVKDRSKRPFSTPQLSAQKSLLGTPTQRHRFRLEHWESKICVATYFTCFCEYICKIPYSLVYNVYVVLVSSIIFCFFLLTFFLFGIEEASIFLVSNLGCIVSY